MKNIILVEGKDDKSFIEYLIQGVEVKPFSVDVLGGLSRDALTKRLDSLKTGFLKNPFEKFRNYHRPRFIYNTGEIGFCK